MTTEADTAPKDTILIIDDSPDNLRVLSKTLTLHGYSSRCVTSGSMAFVSIKNLPPDLILLDIRMPGMNGYEVCQKLKLNAETQDIPVIFISALGDVKDIVKAFQVGGVDYIIKPFQTEEVLARIRSQLTIQKLRKQLSVQNQHLIQEIDERKKFEQALCQEIQRRILIEASLQDAKHAAEAANYAKSKFLAQMSHELRTPLNVILGFTMLIKSEASLTPTYEEYLTTIEGSAHQLLKLINNILSITHTESTQLVFTEQEFDLHQLLNSVVSLWQPKVLEKGLQFEFHCDAEVPQYIQTDERKFRQILMELLENTICLTDKGRVVVKINAKEKRTSASGNSCLLVLEVQSTEICIDLDKLESIFQVFSQTESAQKSIQKLGLSLLLVRQFAQAMGGDLIFKSTPEQEIIFMVHLPVSLAESLAAEPMQEDSMTIVQSRPMEGTITSEALQMIMPNDWLVQLHQAAVKGFDQQIFHLLQEIPTTHISLAKTLEMWTHDFQFDRIVEITQQIDPYPKS